MSPLIALFSLAISSASAMTDSERMLKQMNQQEIISHVDTVALVELHSLDTKIRAVDMPSVWK